jgi:hypothetical protein
LTPEDALREEGGRGGEGRTMEPTRVPRNPAGGGGEDVRAVPRFSRPRDLRVLDTSDDNRADLAGDVTRLVAGEA